jgi:hypothetical protein
MAMDNEFKGKHHVQKNNINAPVSYRKDFLPATDFRQLGKRS